MSHLHFCKKLITVILWINLFFKYLFSFYFVFEFMPTCVCVGGCLKRLEECVRFPGTENIDTMSCFMVTAVPLTDELSL